MKQGDHFTTNRVTHHHEYVGTRINNVPSIPVQLARGGMVPVILEPGERVFPGPLTHAQQGALVTMNQVFPRFADGSLTVPGRGSGDTVQRMFSSGGFVPPRTPSRTIGYQQGGSVSSPTPTSNTVNVHNNFDLRGVTFRSQHDAKEIIKILDDYARKRGDTKL